MEESKRVQRIEPLLIDKSPLLNTVEDILMDQSLPISWEEISYSIKDSMILNDVSGVAYPGEVLGIMGPSGSGKTTLLEILAGQPETSSWTSKAGSVRLGGLDIQSIEYKRLSAYVRQFDIILTTLTAREAFRFSLDMRTSLSSYEKERRVNNLLQSLRLEEVADNIIGGFIDKGVSGGEKKRISIGCELIINPAILLLDEPVSGLDSTTAVEIMKILKDQAIRGKTVILTIHQPSMKVYNMLDKLMLLSEGHLMYQGEREDAESYFEHLGYKHGPQIMPPDHFMNIFFIQNRYNKTDKERSTLRYLINSFKEIKKPEENLMKITASELVYPLVPSEAAKLKYLFIRSAKSAMRNKYMTIMKLVQAVSITLFCVTLFIDVADSFQSINGALFVMVNATIMPSYQNSVFSFQVERNLFFKEKNQGVYGVLVYYLCKSIVELPTMFISNLIFSLGVYWTIGLNNSSPSKFFVFCKIYAVLCLLLSQFCGIGFGYVSSSLFSNLRSAAAGGPMILGFLTLFGGFLVNDNSLPSWIYWMKYLSPFYYCFSILAINEYTDCTGHVCDMDPLGLLKFDDLSLLSLFTNYLLISIAVRALAFVFLKFKKV